MGTIVAKVAAWGIRLGGLVMIVLGLLFWSGNAFTFLNLHMALGSLLVLALWLLAGIYATRKGANLWLAAGAFLVGIVVLGVDMTQTRLLPGSAHVVIEALHLLLGLTLIGFGELLNGRMRRLNPGARVVAAA